MGTQLNRQKSSAITQADELKRLFEEEQKAKTSLAHQVQAAKHDNELLREQWDDEVESRYSYPKHLNSHSHRGQLIQTRREYV